MTNQDLEALLEAGAESPGLDFKASCAWNAPSFAKDILALSNVQDGGHIIIGVDEAADGTFTRRGVSPEHRETFNIDVMRDHMTAYADPHVNFSVEFARDSGGLEFIAIKVFPFDEIPVICRKDAEGLRKATIYFRNRNRRVESAAVSNSYDLRDIVERAAVRMMQRMKGLGLAVEPSARKKLDDELKGL